MTRVLLVHQPVDGGVGRHVADLAQGLSERGEEVILCGPAPPVGTCGDFTHVPLDLRRAVAPGADLGALTVFAGIVRELCPGVIHAHSSKAGAIVRLARLRHPRVPVIYTPHGYAFAGHFEHELERRAYREIERALARLASRVLCVCEAEARLARAVGPAERVNVVHNGIELPPPQGSVDGRIAALARRGPVVCALTQLRPGKGIETLIDALPQVLRERPRAQIAIAGEGPDRAALGARARARGVAEAVHFLGQCDDPVAMLRGGRIFVHPSWAESFPYAILEAMSIGLPTVASAVGGVGEAVGDGEEGLLVAAGDAGALARALLALLADPARGERMGAAARRRVQERFTRAHMTAGVAAVYREILRGSGAGADGAST